MYSIHGVPSEIKYNKQTQCERSFEQHKPQLCFIYVNKNLVETPTD